MSVPTSENPPQPAQPRKVKIQGENKLLTMSQMIHALRKKILIKEINWTYFGQAVNKDMFLQELHGSNLESVHFIEIYGFIYTE